MVQLPPLFLTHVDVVGIWSFVNITPGVVRMGQVQTLAFFGLEMPVKILRDINCTHRYLAYLDHV